MYRKILFNTAKLINKNVKKFRPLISLTLITSLSYNTMHCDSHYINQSTRTTLKPNPHTHSNNDDALTYKQYKIPNHKENYTLYDKVNKFIQYIERLLSFVIYGTPIVALVPIVPYISKYLPGYEEFVWDYCLWTIQRLGPTFIKLAQWASTRPDLYPPKLIERLQKLQDKVLVHYSIKHVETTLQDAFGQNWRDLIEFDPLPIGSGCVAQVYKGKLKEDNINIAIKLIHPHVEKLINIDMDLLSIGAKYLDKFKSLEMLNLGETFGEFGDMMRRQLDLRIEAYNLKTFHKKFQSDSWALFPLPIDGYIQKNVLIETLMEGKSILNYMSLSDDNNSIHILKKKLSDLGCRLILKMIFFDNFVHGDLHPGNILVNFDEKNEPHLVILDCGIVYHSKSPEEHQKLVDICFAFMQHDGRKAGSLLIENNEHTNQLNKEKFCNAVQDLVSDSQSHSYFEHLGEYIGKLCDLARIYMVKLDPGYFAIAMSLKVAEGISLALNKDLDLISTCVPIVVKTRTLRALGIQKFPLPEDNEFVIENKKEKKKKSN